MSFLADSKEELPQPLHREMEILIGPENVKEVLRAPSLPPGAACSLPSFRFLLGG